MSVPSNELTRQQLHDTVTNVEASFAAGKETCHPDTVRLLLGAAKRLLAMKAASDEERRIGIQEIERLDLPRQSLSLREVGAAVMAWQAAERRLLLSFADEPARDGVAATGSHSATTLKRFESGLSGGDANLRR